MLAHVLVAHTHNAHSNTQTHMRTRARTHTLSHTIPPLSLSPAGNWIGGAIMVGAFYACVYGKTIPKLKDAAWDATLGKLIPELP